MIILEAKNISYTYSKGGPFEKNALYNVSLSIQSGELIGIIGHTGSGKSTLIQHFNALLKPTSGEMFVDGQSTTSPQVNLKALRTKVGLVFQYPEHQLFEETVRKDIGFGPKNMGLSPDDIENRVIDAIRIVGLHPDILSKSPFEISGGQKRRVAIAGVLAMKPQVLVLDGPTSGLDPKGRSEILYQIKCMHEEYGLTVILVSHGMEDIANTTERIYVMNNGTIHLQGTPMEIYSHYEELERIGLSAPQITILMQKLCGVDVYTVEQALDYLLPRLKGGNI